MKQELKEKIEELTKDFGSLEEKDLAHKLRQMLHDLELHESVNRAPARVSSLVNDSLALLNSNAPFENMIKTGFSEFDEFCGGFGLGEFVVIGARPGIGKTQLLVNLAIQIAEQHPLLYMTYDLPDNQLSSRFISCVTDIPVQNLLQNQLTDAQKSQLSRVEPALMNLNLFVQDSLSSSISALKSYCEKHIAQDGIKIIFVDYLQMLSSYRHRFNREHEISAICRELKNLAKEHHVCIVATSQLSRAVETRGGNKRPLLSDLRESGAIEQYADKVIFMYRPEYYGFFEDEEGIPTERRVDLIISKNRSGYLGTVSLKRNDRFTSFKSPFDLFGDFELDENRVNELNQITPGMQNLIDKFGLSDTPF
jgi:replicative DNA helicase